MDDLEYIKKTIVPILKRYNIKKAEVFGSYASGNYTSDSDLDLLIMPHENMSLLDFSRLKIELEETLNLKVDLVSYNYINPHLRQSILSTREVVI